MVKQAAKEACILILVAIGIALAVYAVRPDKIGEIPVAVNRESAGQPAIETDFAEISLEEAVRLYEEESAIFADARHAADFEAGRIKGAVNLYVMDQDTWLPGFLYATAPTAMIITYCDGESCHLATELAELLQLNGFGNVHHLKNGWSRWRDGGFPVEYQLKIPKPEFSKQKAISIQSYLHLPCKGGRGGNYTCLLFFWVTLCALITPGDHTV